MFATSSRCVEKAFHVLNNVVCSTSLGVGTQGMGQYHGARVPTETAWRKTKMTEGGGFVERNGSTRLVVSEVRTYFAVLVPDAQLSFGSDAWPQTMSERDKKPDGTTIVQPRQ